MHPVIASTTKAKRKLRVSEAFYSIEGEALMTGVPTLFLRLFGCNFTCSGFGNKEEGNPRVIPITIEKLDDFVPTYGCDSIYAWHPSYKHLTKDYPVDELAAHLVSLLPNGSVVNARNGSTPILSLTGGEPTLHQRGIIELLNEPALADFSKLLIETNCAVTLKQDFLAALDNWTKASPKRFVMWSNSPKLSLSGEAEADAIRPDIMLAQMQVARSVQYVKFVSDGSVESFDEIARVVATYKEFHAASNQHFDGECVYVMPVGATLEEQDLVQKDVALRCMEYGYNFCSRVHVTVFKNSIGT